MRRVGLLGGLAVTLVLALAVAGVALATGQIAPTKVSASVLPKHIPAPGPYIWTVTGRVTLPEICPAGTTNPSYCTVPPKNYADGPVDLKVDLGNDSQLADSGHQVATASGMVKNDRYTMTVNISPAVFTAVQHEMNLQTWVGVYFYVDYLGNSNVSGLSAPPQIVLAGVINPVITCPHGEGNCNTGTHWNPGHNTSFDIQSKNPKTGTEKLSATFGGPALLCETKGTGAVLNFSSVDAGGLKYITYTVYGKDATKAHAAHPNGYICFESTKSFTTSSGKRAKLNKKTHEYYGSLPYCGTNTANDVYPASGSAHNTKGPPCIEWEKYSTSGKTPTWTTWIEATKADPHLVG